MPEFLAGPRQLLNLNEIVVMALNDSGERAYVVTTRESHNLTIDRKSYDSIRDMMAVENPDLDSDDEEF